VKGDGGVSESTLSKNADTTDETVVLGGGGVKTGAIQTPHFKPKSGLNNNGSRKEKPLIRMHSKSQKRKERSIHKNRVDQNILGRMHKYPSPSGKKRGKGFQGKRSKKEAKRRPGWHKRQ